MTAGPLLQDVLVNVRRGRVAYLCLTPEQKRALRDPEGQVALNVLRHLLGARPMNPERFPLAQEALQAIARRLGSLWLLRTSLQTRSAAARSAPR